MKRFGAILVWAMAGVLLIAVCITALADRLSLTPLTVEAPKAARMAPRLVVNLNTATAEELQQIEGLGATFAERILDYRARYGAFRSVDDLLDIDGIGESRLEKWRPYLTV